MSLIEALFESTDVRNTAMRHEGTNLLDDYNPKKIVENVHIPHPRDMLTSSRKGTE